MTRSAGRAGAHDIPGRSVRCRLRRQEPRQGRRAGAASAGTVRVDDRRADAAPPAPNAAAVDDERVGRVLLTKVGRIDATVGGIRSATSARRWARSKRRCLAESGAPPAEWSQHMTTSIWGMGRPLSDSAPKGCQQQSLSGATFQERALSFVGARQTPPWSRWARSPLPQPPPPCKRQRPPDGWRTPPSASATTAAVAVPAACSCHWLPPTTLSLLW